MTRPGVEKVLADPSCRVCGAGGVECAHLVPKSLGGGGYDDPRMIVPLCKPHHEAFDAGRLNLLPYLSKDEQAATVEILGIYRAMKRLAIGPRQGDYHL